jgi:hypothetical protein
LDGHVSSIVRDLFVAQFHHSSHGDTGHASDVLDFMISTVLCLIRAWFSGIIDVVNAHGSLQELGLELQGWHHYSVVGTGILIVGCRYLYTGRGGAEPSGILYLGIRFCRTVGPINYVGQ